MFVYYDPVTGAITSTMNTDFPPEGTYIEIPDQDLGELSGLSVVNGEIVAVDVVPVRNLTIAQINQIAGAIRSRFITDIAAQQMIYLGKRDEALAYLADSDPVLSNYPFIQAEIGITAPTAYELAQLWLNMQGLWVYVASNLETMRLGYIEQVRLAPDRATCAAVLTAFRQAVTVFD